MGVTFPDLATGPDLTVSATGFLTWLKCPERGLSRFEGVYDEGSIATFRGIVAHRVFARHLADGPIADDDFSQVCREEIGKGLNPAMVSLGLRPSGVQAVIEEVRVLYRSFVRLPVESLRHVEVQLDEEAAPGLRLRGVIDAVFEEDGEGVRLTDWKTGQLGEAATQLAFYSLLWTVQNDSPPVRLEAISVSNGERHEERPTEASLSEIAARVTGMVNDVRLAMTTGKRLERVAGPWCASCPLRDSCAEGISALAVLGN